jgi:hypothetical protein
VFTRPDWVPTCNLAGHHALQDYFKNISIHTNKTLISFRTYVTENIEDAGIIPGTSNKNTAVST